MKAAELFVRCLEKAVGVECMSGAPGAENLEPMDALTGSPACLVTIGHEQGVAVSGIDCPLDDRENLKLARSLGEVVCPI